MRPTVDARENATIRIVISGYRVRYHVKVLESVAWLIASVLLCSAGSLMLFDAIRGKTGLSIPAAVVTIGLVRLVLGLISLWISWSVIGEKTMFDRG